LASISVYTTSGEVSEIKYNLAWLEALVKIII
jgi:hypothetical protein